MKTNVFRKIVYLMSVILFLLPSNDVYAKDYADAYVTAETTHVIHDNTSVEVSVIIRNNGIEPVANLSIEGILPNDLMLSKDTQYKQELSELLPGGATEFLFSYNLKNEESKPNGGNTIISDNIENSKLNVDDAGDSSTGIETGDQCNFVLIGLLLLSASVLLFIIIKNKKATCLLLCLSMLTVLVSASSVAEAKDISDKKIQIYENVQLGNNEYNLQFNFKYDTVEVVKVEGKLLTRAEWIATLLDALGINNEKVDYERIGYPFSDIKEHAYGDKIAYAYETKIITKANEEFFPDNLATREFVAMSLANSFLINAGENFTCQDIHDITYKKEVGQVVACGLLTLEDGRFYPHRNITQKESDYAIKKLKLLLEPPQINETVNDITYKKDVVKLSADTIYEENNNIVTIISSSNNIEEGNIFVLPNGNTYKALSVRKENNTVIINVENATFEETVDKVKLCGKKSLETFELISSEDVLLDNGDIQTYTTEGLDETDKLRVLYHWLGNNTLNLEFNGTEVKAPLDVSLNITFGELAYMCDLNEDKSVVEQGFLSLPYDVSLSFSHSKEIGDGNINILDLIKKLVKKINEANLGLTIPIGGGFSLSVPIILEATESAEIGLSLNYQGEIFVHVKNNKAISKGAPITHQHSTVAELSGNVEVMAGIRAILEFMEVNVISAGIAMGPTVKVTGKIEHSPELACLDANIYLSMRGEILKGTFLDSLLGLGLEHPIWDENNSPLKRNAHYESYFYPQGTYAYVKACTLNSVAESSELEGIIKNKDNPDQLIKNLYIEIKSVNSEDFSEEIVAEINPERNHFIQPLKYGNYKICISAPGYVPYEELIFLKPDEKLTKEFYIEQEKNICRIKDRYYTSISEALIDAQNNDIIEVLTGYTENKSILIPEGLDVTIKSNSRVDIFYSDSTMTPMIINNGKLTLQGPIKFEYTGASGNLFVNNSIAKLEGGVVLDFKCKYGSVVSNDGSLYIGDNGGYTYSCYLSGIGPAFEFGIWNEGQLITNNNLFSITNVAYGILTTSNSTQDFSKENYFYNNVSHPVYKFGY